MKVFPHGSLEHRVCGTLMNMYLIYSYQPMIICYAGKYERVCQQKHQLHELHEIRNLKKKSSFPFLRLGENLPSDAMRYMVCLIDNVDKC